MKRHLIRLFKIIAFVVYYIKELVVASSILAFDIVRPKSNFKPAIIQVPIDLESDIAIIALVNLISMTPGSLSVDLSADKKSIFVHAMYVTDKQAFIDDLKKNLEKRIKEVFE